MQVFDATKVLEEARTHVIRITDFITSITECLNFVSYSLNNGSAVRL